VVHIFDEEKRGTARRQGCMLKNTKKEIGEMTGIIGPYRDQIREKRQIVTRRFVHGKPADDTESASEKGRRC